MEVEYVVHLYIYILSPSNVQLQSPGWCWESIKLGEWRFLHNQRNLFVCGMGKLELLRKRPPTTTVHQYANHSPSYFAKAPKLSTLNRHRPRSWDLIYCSFKRNALVVAVQWLVSQFAIYRPFMYRVVDKEHFRAAHEQ